MTKDQIFKALQLLVPVCAIPYLLWVGYSNHLLPGVWVGTMIVWFWNDLPKAFRAVFPERRFTTWRHTLSVDGRLEATITAHQTTVSGTIFPPEALDSLLSLVVDLRKTGVASHTLELPNGFRKAVITITAKANQKDALMSITGGGFYVDDATFKVDRRDLAADIALMLRGIRSATLAYHGWDELVKSFPEARYEELKQEFF